MSFVKIMLDYAFSKRGKAYIWGANGPDVGDCSGWVQHWLSIVGKNPKWDQNAQGLYYKLKSKQNVTKQIMPGRILFFGKNLKSITHVAIAYDSNNMIECGGGGKSCTTVEVAMTLGACVRIVPISRRKDLVSIVNIF